MVAHACIPSNGEAETGGSQGQPDLQASQGYIMRPCLNKEINPGALRVSKSYLLGIFIPNFLDIINMPWFFSVLNFKI